jgi:hypothetical protein
VSVTAIGDLPALEANAQLERVKGDYPLINIDSSDDRPVPDVMSRESSEGARTPPRRIWGILYEEDHQAALQMLREENPYLIEDLWTFARHVFHIQIRPYPPDPRFVHTEENLRHWLVPIETHARRGTPQQVRQRDVNQELRELKRFLEKDGLFIEMSRSLRRMYSDR